jgi:membrane-bound inhibitor of C-type lysozyme
MIQRFNSWVFALMTVTASAADLTIHLPDDASISHKSVRYQCDAHAAKLGLPSDAFPVEYINGGGNSLAVVPIAGKPMIFVTVLSGSGARYAAQQYIWWEAHGTVTVSSTPEKGSASCHPVP